MLLNIFFDALIPNHSVLMELFILVKVEQVFVNQKHVFIFWIAHLNIHTVTILSFLLNRSKVLIMGYFSPRVTLRRVLTQVTSIILTSVARHFFSYCLYLLILWSQWNMWQLIGLGRVLSELSPTLIGFTFITRFFFFLPQSCCRSNQFRTPVFCDNFENLLENQQQTCKQTYIPVNKQLKIWTSPFSCLVQDENSN